MSTVIELVAPRRLGRPFRGLLTSSWLTNLGDGIAIAAGPLLVASETDSKFLVAMAALLNWLPPLLFSLSPGSSPTATTGGASSSPSTWRASWCSSRSRR